LIGFVPNLMQQNIGITPPDSIYVLTGDLTNSDTIGYEAQAVSGNPNIIEVNNQFLKNKSTAEIAEILAHEMLHLATYKLPLFGGRNYAQPWLNEGIAVYFETLAHRLIFTDSTQKVLSEDLNRTFAPSPDEASVLYDQPFDYAFDG